MGGISIIGKISIRLLPKRFKKLLSSLYGFGRSDYTLYQYNDRYHATGIDGYYRVIILFSLAIKIVIKHTNAAAK